MSQSAPPTIRLHDSLTRKKVVFEPLEPGRVGLYGCGVTVYDSCHLGHAMQAIVFDVIVRWLRYRGFEVTYVRNYTDVDDKIIVRAQERGMSPLALSAEMIAREERDMAALGIAPPTFAPKVSDFIPQIVAFIQGLIDNGAAYLTEQGNVYYRVRSKADYGKLSGRKVDELLQGVRKGVEDDKEDALDFALWKAEDVEGAAWDSPFGRGRPGWHIECSVMGHELLGEEFDIHGGGLDLIFPHHENEVAQSESFTGRQHVRYWIHNGLLTVNRSKMSKSEGNFYTIADGLEKFGAELIRFSQLQYHYRSNVDFNPQAMAANAARLAGAYERLLRLEDARAAVSAAGGDPDGPLEEVPEGPRKAFETELAKIVAAFGEAMDDDFNCPEAIVALMEGLKLTDDSLRRKKCTDEQRARLATRAWAELKPLAAVLGLLQQEPAAYFEELEGRFLEHAGLTEEWIRGRMAERDRAREAKDWTAADAIRDELAAKGVELRDRPSGTDWTVSKDALEELYA